MKPITRKEIFKNAIAYGEKAPIKPMTRKEIIMAKEAKREASGGGVSDCDWNTMKNKPFGEKTVMGDTLTWDGNTEGKYTVGLGDNIAAVHISDTIPKIADFANGVSAVNADGSTTTYTSEEIIEVDAGFIVSSDASFTVIPTDNYTPPEDTIVYEKAGIYVVYMTSGDNPTYVKDLTINGYTGFERTETVPLPNKYLDIIETVGGDTLTWDGNTEGLDCVDGVFHKVSDVVLTENDFVNGGTIAIKGLDSDGEPIERVGTASIMTDAGMTMILVDEAVGALLVIPTDGLEAEGMVFEKKGIYTFPFIVQLESFSLTINGYTGFTKEQVKEEYLPSGVIDLGDVTVEDGMIEVADKSYTPILDRFTKGYDVTFKYILDGMTIHSKAIGVFLDNEAAIFTLADGLVFGENGGMGGIAFTTP